jgi:hypothetical protein
VYPPRHCSDYSHIILSNNLKWEFRKNIEIKFTYVKNDTAEISIKNHFYHYPTCEMVICDSDGITGKFILHRYEQYWFFFNKMLAYFSKEFKLWRFFIIQKNFFFCLFHFELTSFYSNNNNNNNNNNKIVMCHLHSTLGLLILSALWRGIQWHHMEQLLSLQACKQIAGII